MVFRISSDMFLIVCWGVWRGLWLGLWWVFPYWVNFVCCRGVRYVVRSGVVELVFRWGRLCFVWFGAGGGGLVFMCGAFFFLLRYFIGLVFLDLIVVVLGVCGFGFVDCREVLLMRFCILLVLGMVAVVVRCGVLV